MTATEPAPRGRRLRVATIAGMLLLHGLTLLVWTGTWVTGRVEESPLAVGGDSAAPALPALALCGLALAAALSISGPFFRVVLGVLQVLLGFSVALSGVLVIVDPVAAAASAVTARTGISGAEGVAELLDAAATTVLPAGAVILGTGSAALGLLLVATGRRWPSGSRRFSAVSADRVENAVGVGAIGEWDALSSGADPTAEPDGARGTDLGDGTPRPRDPDSGTAR